MNAARALTVSAFLLSLSTGAAASAQSPVHLFTRLTIFEEPHVVIPLDDADNPRPTPFGRASFVLSADRTELLFTAIIHNIDLTGTQTPSLRDNLSAAHIHAPLNPATNTAPVVWGFFGLPFNDTNPTNVVMTPFLSGVGGTFSGAWDLLEGNGTTLTDQIPNILGEQAYINFHTVQHPAGEIRGTLNVVPEPATVFLLGTGLVVVAGAARRRRSRAG